jgi:hypothetical protein
VGKRWTLLRCQPFGIQLLYHNLSKARKTMSWICQHREEVMS